jgi:PAS domain S-box-containing protein
LDNIPQRVFWKDRNAVYLGCNKPFALDASYEDPGELVGKTSFETASGALADRYRADDREVMETGTPKINYEQMQIRPDGSHAWLITSKVPMYDQDYQVIGVLGTYSDITERKKAEEALRESEERFSTFFRTSPVGTSITRLSDGQFVDINDAFLGLFGYTREEVIGQDPLKLGMWANPEDRAKMVEILQEQGRIKDFETLFVIKSGEIRDVSVSSELIEAAGEQYILGLTRDITKRKRAETALKASEEKYRELVQSANSIILRMDVSGKVTFFNEFAQVFFGYSEDEMLGKNVVGTIVPELESTGRDLRAMIEDIGVNPDRYMNNVNENMLRNGERVWVSWTNKPVFGENGRIKEILCIGNDITERKRGEEERKKLEEQLFQAQKMESVGRLAGGVAHDFNNMLGVIIGRAEMALQQDVSNDKLQHNLKEILKAAQRSADLTKQLLAFARKQTAVRKILDLNSTISSMLNMLRRLIGEDIDLSWQPGLDLWKVKIDPSQVDQILANLAVNARDAVSGVGAVTIKAENVVIDDSNSIETPEFIPGEYVLLSMSDTGTGMSEEVREKIFEPFFTTKELGKGTGLGLSTVYGIVKQNDGFIYVESEPGKGTTFKIYLQRFEPEAAQVPSEHAAVKRLTGTETILLVEDDEAVLDLSKMMLEKLGYTVLAAHTHVHAMHLVKEHPRDIHLLITDVVMPEMNGRELAEQLRVIRPNLKCLYMSGYTADAIAHHGILDEGLDFIQKPFGNDDLAAKVRHVLDHLV